MSFFTALDVSASGLAAQRMRMQVIARNISNVGVTRDAHGRVNPPKHMLSVFQVGAPELTGSEDLGVRFKEMRPSAVPFREDHNPQHPDADPKTGLVRLPNIRMPLEMTDMMMASRAYEANITAIDMTRRMINATLQILA